MKNTTTNGLLEKRIQALEKEAAVLKAENAKLLDRVAKSKALSDATFEAIFLSEKGICLEQNKTAERLFGYTTEEAVGRPGTDWVVPEDRERVKQNMLSGFEQPYEVTALRKDGTTFPCEIQAHMMVVQGKTIRVTHLRNLSKRKQTEDALSDSDRRFRELAENIHEVFWVFDWREQRVVYVNPAYELLWGRSVQKLLENYEEWAESIHPDDRAHANESFLKIVSSGGGENREYRIIRPDGELRWVSDRGFTVCGKDGKVRRVVGIAEDITSQKLAEQRLRDSEEKFSKAFHSSPDAIAISRMSDGKILEVNEGLTKITGFQRDELIGRTTSELELWADPSDRQHFVQMMAKQGSVKECEYRLKGKSGEVGRGLMSGEVIQIGHEECLLVIVRDITEQTHARETLKASEEAYRNIIEASPMGIIMYELDDDDRLIFVGANSAFEKILGVTHEDFIGKTIEEAFPDIVKTELPEQYRKVAREGGTWRSDGLHYEENDIVGTYKIVAFQTQQNKVAVLFENIIDQQQTKKALQESEERLRNIVEHSTNLFYAHTDENELTYLSPQCRDFLQCDPEEAMTRWTEFASDNPINQKGIASTEKAIKTGKRQPLYELELVGMKGRKIWVEVNEAPIVKNNKTVAIVGSLTDITERKRAEEELKKAHQTFLTVLDGIDATIYVADMDTYEILFMNQCMIDLFNGNLIGERCHEVFRKERLPCGHCTNDQLIDKDGHPTGVCTWETQNPITKRWYINYDRAIRWIDGRMVRIQIATDITRLKVLEQERIETEMQLRQAQKMESVGRLAGGVAHDFNNMLGVIIGHAELLMEQLEPSLPLHDDLKEIYKAARRSADLTRQLLAFARKQTILPKVLNLNDTVAGMLRMLQRLIGEDIDLVWKPCGDIWAIKIDPAQIDQILANLCVNARDAITGTGKITIETKNMAIDQDYCSSLEGMVPGEYVMLEVTDSGCGMDKDTLRDLFEPFFTTKGVGEGTGLGLSTVYGIVKQNNGFVYVQSTLNKGSTFSIYLQRTADIEKCDRKLNGKAIKAGSETILLVEDEPSFLRLGKTVLERFGYRILAAQVPNEALALSENEPGPIHLLITDVVMPQMNGVELKTKIARIKPDIKVLFMSGYTPDTAINRGVLEEGMHFLSKPFSVSSLSSKVREILDEE